MGSKIVKAIGDILLSHTVTAADPRISSVTLGDGQLTLTYRDDDGTDTVYGLIVKKEAQPEVKAAASPAATECCGGNPECESAGEAD